MEGMNRAGRDEDPLGGARALGLALLILLGTCGCLALVLAATVAGARWGG